MSDLINRQDVLELIDNYNSDGLGSVFFSYADGEKFKNAILALPSAQKTGKWMPEFEGKYTGGAYWFKCSCCEKIVPGGLQSDYRYCPHCGSRNRGDGE